MSSSPEPSLVVADLRLDYRPDLTRALGSPPTELTDAALVHLALERWGTDALARIEGDFALAWYRPRSRTLVLARDPLGQRPLFWSRRGQRLTFASMPRGLHASGEVARAPDLASVAGFMANGQHPRAHSFFDQVQRVSPGHYVIVTPNGVEERAFWKPEERDDGCRSFEEYVEAYRRKLDDAVATRLPPRSAPLATHLSGGLDSGAVSATAARLHDGPLFAFTAVPSALARVQAGALLADEGPLAARTASLHSSIRHRLVEPDGSSPLDQLADGLRLHERPKFNLCNHGWLSHIRREAVANGAKVILTGEIGNWTISAGPIAAMRSLWQERGMGGWLAAAHSLRTVHGARWQGILASTFLSPWVRERLQPSPSPLLTPAFAPEHDATARSWRDDARHAFAAMDFGEYRAGTKASSEVEERDPTADPRLIAFALSLPVEMVMGPSGRRPLALAALGDRLPQDVLRAPRKGYQGSDWHLTLSADRDRLQALVEAIVASPVAGEVIDTVRLRKLWEAWPTGGWDRSNVMQTYRNGFLQALTAGHFLIGASGEPLPF
ncbi:asparagine synthetase B family protein [Sphingomonas swuensis]|uniref:asparagine synthetase B family protein n=1 Tax=Sphingomonas swuensis TaxID=977800 RepID=UPI0031DAFA24